MGSEFAPWSEWNDVRGVEWWLEDHAPHATMAGLISQLNSLCDDHPALWRCDREPEGFEWIDDRNAEDSLTHSFAVRPSMMTQFLSSQIGLQSTARLSDWAPRDDRWKVVLDTDDAQFGGSGYRKVAESPDVVDAESVEWQGRPTSIVVDVPPLSMLWLVEVST